MRGVSGKGVCLLKLSLVRERLELGTDSVALTGAEAWIGAVVSPVW